MTKIMKAGLAVLVMLLVGASALLVSAITQQHAINEAEAKAIAQRAIEGEVSEVEFESNTAVYEVEVRKDGTEQEVTISAQTGEVLTVEDDEAEGQDVPIIGSALERASAAALAHIGEGRVTDSEIGDEEGYYEIEIRLNNGREADVHLDENFNVLSTEYD